MGQAPSPLAEEWSCPKHKICKPAAREEKELHFSFISVFRPCCAELAWQSCVLSLQGNKILILFLSKAQTRRGSKTLAVWAFQNGMESSRLCVSWLFVCLCELFIRSCHCLPFWQLGGFDRLQAVPILLSVHSSYGASGSQL